MRHKRCTRCLNDTTVRGISFDKQGLCNFCRGYDSIKEQLEDYQKLEQLFLERINKEKGKHRYDAAVGFSGGKDSTYVLYKLVNEYGLKVIAFTLDNGFLSPEARLKIDSLIKELKVEHEYVVFDNSLLKDMYKHIVGKYISPCIACSYLGYAAMINYASRVDAGVCVHGRSRAQMLRGYANGYDDSFKPFIESGLKSIYNVDLDSLYAGVMDKVGNLIDKNLAKRMEETLLKEAKAVGYRDFIAYFLYHPYNKDEVINYITLKTSWKVTSEEEHFDCLIHNGARYLKDLIARRPHALNELSVQIREGLLSREEGMTIVDTKIGECPLDEIKMLCDYAGINQKILLSKARLYSKRWW